MSTSGFDGKRVSEIYFGLRRRWDPEACKSCFCPKTPNRITTPCYGTVSSTKTASFVHFFFQ